MSAGSESDRSDATPNVETRLHTWRDRPIAFGVAALLVLFGLPYLIWLMGGHAGKEENTVDTESKQMVVEGEKRGAGDEDGGSDGAGSAEISGRTPVSDAHLYVKELLVPDTPEQVRFMNRVEQIQSNWEKLHQEATEWYGRRDQLLAGEEGKRLAAKEHLVERFMQSEQWERPTLDEVTQLKERLAGFVVMAEKVKEPLAVEEDPSQEVFDELTTLGEDVSTALEQMTRVCQHVNALEQEASALPPATESLEEAMKRVHERAMERQADDILAERQERIDEQNDKLLALEIEEVGRRTGRELAKAREETARLEVEKRRVEEEAKEAARKREEALFWADLDGRFEREYPAMEKYLTAFTSEGYTQMIAGEFRPIAIKRPVSYQRLVDAGLLNAGEESFRAFWGALDSGTNDRELGAFPAHSFSSGHRERHYETVVKVRDFLREFGPLMAKKKRDCLSP